MGFITNIINFPFFSIVKDDIPAVAELMDNAQIIEPDPIRFTFDTPGWYFLGFLILSLLVLVFIRFMIIHKKNAYRRDAIKELDSISQTPDNKVADILALLKIVAIQTYGRSKVAELSGGDWFSFLDNTGKRRKFSSLQQKVLPSFYNEIEIESEVLNEFISESRKWIKTHA